jgi:hypothetical protein
MSKTPRRETPPSTLPVPLAFTGDLPPDFLAAFNAAVSHAPGPAPSAARFRPLCLGLIVNCIVMILLF